MIRRFRICVIQNNAGADWDKNLHQIRRLTARALARKPELIAYPEVFAWRGPSSEIERIARSRTPELIGEFRRMAARNRCAVLLGSVLEPSGKSGRVYNTSFLIDAAGKIAARYRKIHLFDCFLKGAEVCESDRIVRGRRLVLGTIRGIRTGLSICYDLRFPELYRALVRRGARILFVPANFTYPTGLAHWETLLRARAIENQCYVIAPAQTGIHPGNGIRSFGTSLVIDPWGRTLARAGRVKAEVLTVDLDFGRQERLRKRFPVLEHRRI